MNLICDGEEIRDPDGQEFSSLEALEAAVMLAARELIGEDARRGVIDLRFRIEVQNGAAQVVYALPFEDAVRIISNKIYLEE